MKNFKKKLQKVTQKLLKNVYSRNIICSATVRTALTKRDLFKGFPSSTASTSMDCFTLTTTDEKMIELIKKEINIGAETITKREAVVGSGTVRFTGSEWCNGSVFVGKNITNTHMLRFEGNEGLQMLSLLARSGHVD